MKMILTFFAFTLSAVCLYAWDSPAQSVTLTPNSRQIVVSTNTATPSKFLDSDPFAQRSYIINTSSFTIYLSSTATTINTAIAVFIPPAFTISGGTLPYTFSPDGVNSPYAGNLFGVANGNTPPTITVIRVK